MAKMAKTPPVECLVGSPYGIDCNRVNGCDVNGCDASGVVCHVDGWGRVEVSSGGSVSWQVNGCVKDEDRAICGAGGS